MSDLKDFQEFQKFREILLQFNEEFLTTINVDYLALIFLNKRVFLRCKVYYYVIIRSTTKILKGILHQFSVIACYFLLNNFIIKLYFVTLKKKRTIIGLICITFESRTWKLYIFTFL